MKRLIIILIGMVLINDSFGQCRRDINWFFGYNTMKHKGTRIIFSPTKSTIDSIKLFENFSGYAAFISSRKDGEFLMYSNGCRIYGSDYQVLENGYGINDISAEAFASCYSFENLGHYGWMQDCLFIPCDDNDSCFLYIYKPRNKYDPPKPNIDKIAMAKIIKKGDGKYKVVTKDSIFYNKPNTVSGLNLIKEADSNKWWLTSSSDSADAILIFEIEGAIFKGVKKQYFKQIKPEEDNCVSVKFSPDGNLYAKYDVPLDSANCWVRLFSFDRGIGEFSYLQSWKVPMQKSLSGGVEFSGSGRFLYVSAATKIFQYDLWAADIPCSVETVAEYDGFQELGFAGNFFYPQRAPDCRIYINSSSSLRYLHYIDKPEVKGIGCDVMQHALELYEWHSGSIPYYPNYRLDTGCPACDSTIALPDPVATYSVPVSRGYIKVYPNPVKDMLVIYPMAGTLESAGQIEVIDINGLKQYTSIMEATGSKIELNVSHWPKGMYVVIYTQRGKILQTEKVFLVN